MQRSLSAEDAQFQAKMREFMTTQVPQELRDKVSAGVELTKDEIVLGQRILNEGGYAVPHWPVEWGGRDWTPRQLHIWQTEMQDAGVPALLPFNVSMVGPVIATFGNDEQKKRFLPPTANLDIWWCQGFSEPDAGSDLASLRTVAVRDGDEFVVNGQKTWTTMAQHADWIFCLVRTDSNVKKQAGISFLLIDMTTAGIEVRPIQLLDGGHEVNEVFFTDVRVPAENLVGEENKGWDYAKFLLGNERSGIAPVGGIKRHLAQIKTYAAGISTADGGALLGDPLVAARIAELEAELMALEVTVLRVAGSSHDGKPDPASSILKIRATQLQQEVLEFAVDVAGPMSLVWLIEDDALGEVEDDAVIPGWARRSTPAYLNFRKASIYGGSNEVQRSIIAGSVLGLKV
ncbi:MAG: acyl-CoA dehydrogenase family protein [Dermatophilaceae bacterium]|nr:acyl-CoA dehydrogenase family protein [Intrasporangiaceae bacterium]